MFEFDRIFLVEDDGFRRIVFEVEKLPRAVVGGVDFPWIVKVATGGGGEGPEDGVWGDDGGVDFRTIAAEVRKPHVVSHDEEDVRFVGEGGEKREEEGNKERFHALKIRGYFLMSRLRFWVMAG